MMSDRVPGTPVPGDDRWRPWLLDGQLLLFDRESGVNQLLSGEETAHLRMVAPRTIQVSITNACNRSCDFCYRPADAESLWTFEDLVELARVATDWGALELAFGGGEPLLFDGFVDLMHTIWNETPLCPHFTTNGALLTPELLRRLRGCTGQIQLSIYDDLDHRPIIDMLVASGQGFGLNLLVTPRRLRTLEADVLSFHQRGVRDILFLSYRGADPGLHLSASQCRGLDRSLTRLHRIFAGKMSFKVDVCWGKRLVHTPRLLDQDDCGAGRVFLSLGADKKMLPCSFFDHAEGAAVTELARLPAMYRDRMNARPAVEDPGCARRADR